MARQARAVSSKGLYYVELKGDTLFSSQNDRDTFLNMLADCFGDSGKIYGVTLADGSARMVVKESSAGISAAVKSLKIQYARYFNKTAGRTGKLFADRFKSVPYESIAEAEAAAKELGNMTTTPKPAKKTAAKSVKTGSAAKSVKKPTAKPVKKTAAKTAVEVKAEKTQETEEKPAKKKVNRNLPSWLL